MRVIIEAVRRNDKLSGSRPWKASVEYGEGHSNTFVAYGETPIEASMELNEYLADELLTVRQKARML